MKYITFLIAILILIIFSQCKISQYSSIESTDTSDSFEGFSEGEPGKCYTKYWIPEKTEYYSKDYIIFTGNENEEQVDIRTEQLLLNEESSEWIKRKTDINCLSSNPDDCYIWCLIKTEPEIREVKILIDTNQTKNYIIETIQFEEIVQKGTMTDWRESICGKDITAELVRRIQVNLKSMNFYSHQINSVLDSNTKNSLRTFQKESNLPIGPLNIETLENLNIYLISR